MDKGWFALLGVAFGALGTILGIIGSIVRDLINSKSQVRLEKIKIHDKDRLEAYKELYSFSRRIVLYYNSLRGNEISDFADLMKTSFEKKIKPNLLYYSSKIVKILDEYDEMYFSALNRGELTEEKDRQLHDFINNGLAEKAIVLQKLIKSEYSSSL